MRVRFEEVQRFRQIWLWGLVGITVVPSLVFGIWQVGSELGELGGGSPWGGLISVSVGVGVVALLGLAHLETVVDDRGIWIRFFPFHRAAWTVELDRVRSVEAIAYRPIWEYGGWGIRYRRCGKAYTVSGNRGVLFTFDDGRTLLIGSRCSRELAEAVRTLRSR